MAKKNEAPKKAAPKKTEPIELTKAVLLAAAKDINAADIADPAIDVKGSEAQLKKALKAASEIVEPEDELKPETFAVLKAVAEEAPEDEDENSEDGTDTDEDEDEEVAADTEPSLEDLTVEELQTRCKAYGIPFKAKKTTKAQLIALLEANTETEGPDEEPEEKPVPEKKAEKSKSEKRNYEHLKTGVPKGDEKKKQIEQLKAIWKKEYFKKEKRRGIDVAVQLSEKTGYDIDFVYATITAFDKAEK